jgi:hypothetical protein
VQPSRARAGHGGRGSAQARKRARSASAAPSDEDEGASDGLQPSPKRAHPKRVYRTSGQPRQPRTKLAWTSVVSDLTQDSFPQALADFLQTEGLKKVSPCSFMASQQGRVWTRILRCPYCHERGVCCEARYRQIVLGAQRPKEAAEVGKHSLETANLPHADHSKSTRQVSAPRNTAHLVCIRWTAFHEHRVCPWSLVLAPSLPPPVPARNPPSTANSR